MVGSAVLGVATIAVLYQLYSAARVVRAEHARVAGELAVEDSRGAFLLARTLTAAGVVAAALGAALVLVDPWETAGAAVIATVLGGPALFLIGDLVTRHAASGRIAGSRLVALGCLAVLALIAFALPALILAALAFAVLLLLSLAASGWFRLPSMSVND